jgi:hypothetical protein
MLRIQQFNQEIFHMKNVILKTAILSTLAAVGLAATGVASAEDKKHGARVYINAPIVGSHYGHGHGHRYHNSYYAPSYRHGYRHRDHRWVAPVAIAATVGALAIAANSHYDYTPTTTYYPAPATTYYSSPAPTYYNSAPVYASPSHVTATTYYVDQFDAADRNRNGYVSYHEATRVNSDWGRNFGRIDTNHDGFITRDEVNWFYRR